MVPSVLSSSTKIILYLTVEGEMKTIHDQAYVNVDPATLDPANLGPWTLDPQL